MRALYHCHTKNSSCSNLKIEELKNYLIQNKIKYLFITDHNKITLPEFPNCTVIPSTEVSTKEGDIIGVFIKKEISRGLSIKKTAELIHLQGGVVIAPHPTDIYRREAIGENRLINNIDLIDIIETGNSRNLSNKSDIRAKEIAKKYNKPIISGSDAHFIEELDNSIMEIDPFTGPKEFMEKLSKAKFTFKRAGVRPHLKTFLSKLRRSS